jgi:hypothetical protein
MPVRQPRPLHPTSLLALGLLVYAGCSSSSATSVAVSHPTMIEVAPEDFLGSVPCSEGPGLKRYVATLFDTNYVAQGGGNGIDPESDAQAGGAGPDFQLPSSPATPCLAGVGFGLVVAGRHYDVKIDGYDTDDLAPRAVGSRQMVSPAPLPGQQDTPLATPRWTAHCEDAVAVDSTIVRADHCAPFTVVDREALGSVRIPLGRLLGGLSCGDQLGQVDHFSVSLSAGTNAPLVQTVACDPKAEALFTELSPRQRVSAYITALSADDTDATADGNAFAGATCDAFTLPEASVDAECTSLSQVGTLRVDLPGVLELLDLECDSGTVESVAVSIGVPGGEMKELSFPRPDCRQPFTHGFAPGPANVTVIAVDPEGEKKTATCTATVTPAQLAIAECTSN